MRKITLMSFAFRALLITTAPASADAQQANTSLKQIGHIGRQAPTAQINSNAYGAYAQSGEIARQICTYIGGPKGSWWACR